MMSSMNSDKEIKIIVCRICLAPNCDDMVLLDQQNGWLTLFEYCFGIALTIQDKPRVICKTCADNIKRYAKFKDLCLKSDNVWKSSSIIIADVKCNIAKTVKLEENILNTEQNLQSSNNKLLTNNNESLEMTCDSDSSIFYSDNNVDAEFTETKFEIDNDIQSIKEETTHVADIGHINEKNSHLQQWDDITNEVDIVNDEEAIENVCENNNSEIQSLGLKQECSEYTKSLHSQSRNKLNGKKFYTCTKCKKKYTRKKWYLTHKKVCTRNSNKNHKLQNDVDNGSVGDSDNVPIKKKGAAIAKNELHSYKCTKENSKTIKNKDNSLLFCGLCKFNCNSVDMLFKHLDEHWSNNDLACKLCEFIGDDLADITVHRFSHLPSKWLTRFRCHICQQLKFSKLSLHFHYRLVHLKKSGGFCSRCNKEFRRFKSWRVHERAHVTPGYTCDICGKNFVYKYLIKDHLLNHTNQVHNICDVCGKTFKRTRYLRIHIETVHVKTDPLKCTHCNKMFKSQLCLDFHRKTFTKDKLYKCEVCFKEFSYIFLLKSHMVMHSDERRHCCDICGSKYKSKSQLTVHMRKHTGILPFKCMTCSKEFATPSQLKTHSTVHTGVRRHRCMHCTRSFHSKKHLGTHCALQHKNEIVKSNE